MRRIVGHTNGQARHISEPLVQARQLRRASSQNDAVVHKVSGKFRFYVRNKFIQGVFNLTKQSGKRFFANLFGIDRNDQLATFGCINTLYFIIKFLIRRTSGANLDLDVFSLSLSSEKIVLFQLFVAHRFSNCRLLD